MRRGKTKKEEQVDRFNAQSSAPVVTYISEDDFRCEYCSALTRKPKILHFHGFEPSCIWLRHRTVSKIRVDIDELRGDDFRAGQPDGTADGFRVDVGYRWKRSDGSEVVGALRSTNCSKVLIVTS
jgi:hypothetical protein